MKVKTLLDKDIVDKWSTAYVIDNMFITSRRFTSSSMMIATDIGFKKVYDLKKK